MRRKTFSSFHVAIIVNFVYVHAHVSWTLVLLVHYAPERTSSNSLLLLNKQSMKQRVTNKHIIRQKNSRTFSLFLVQKRLPFAVQVAENVPNTMISLKAFKKEEK